MPGISLKNKEKNITLSTTFENNSNKTVKSLKLALGIFWEKNGKINDLPIDFDELRKNEEVITLESLDIKPEERKELNVKVDRLIPFKDKGKFITNLRILSVELDKN